VNLQQVAETSFVLVQADWSTEKCRRLIRYLEPSHVIVHSDTPQELYYLYRASEALARLSQAPAAASIGRVLDLHESGATPLLEVYDDAAAAPDWCVVHEQGRVVGFLDASSREEPLRTRGASRGGVEEVLGYPERTGRSLVAEFPGEVTKGKEAWLLVRLSATIEAGTGIAVELPIGAPIDVLVQARRGFILKGTDKGTLTVSDEETLALMFKLEAVDLGAARVNVLAFHQGQPLGKITLSSTVVEGPIDAVAGEPVALQHERQLAPVSVTVPDLSMLIEERQGNAGIEYLIRLTTRDPIYGFNLKRFGPIQLRADPMAFFGEFFAEIEDLPLDTSRDKEVAARKLAARGADLFQKAFPKDLQETLWSLRHSITSIIVQSEEPWIPWELCRLSGEEDGRVVEGEFLCEAYAITRWVPGLGFKQPLSLANLAVVVPDDSRLPFAHDERDYLLSLAGNGRRVTRIPANYLDVGTSLASGEYDGWHFTGHGAARNENPDRSVMVLEEGEEFTPQDVSGEVTNLRTGRPLVFLNACQIGRGGMSLTGIGGWAQRFVDAGAGAFVGAYWNVYDQSAFDFAQALYDRLLAGKAIGEAVKEARAIIRGVGDPTWLAYTVFADPLSQVQT
jgi:hypothetical protein